jgi:DnaJ-class molecular chaperone
MVGQFLGWLLFVCLGLAILELLRTIYRKWKRWREERNERAVQRTRVLLDQIKANADLTLRKTGGHIWIPDPRTCRNCGGLGIVGDFSEGNAYDCTRCAGTGSLTMRRSND